MSLNIFKYGSHSITIWHKLFAGLAASAVIIIFISVISVVGINTLINENDWIEKSEHVENHLDHVYDYNLQIESGDRGYILTGNDTYLAKRKNAIDELRLTLKNLELETAGNREQQKMLAKLASYIEESIDYSNRRVEARKSVGEARARLLFPVSDGSVLIDNIHNLVLEMISRQDRILISHKMEYRAQMSKNKSIIIMGFLSQLVLFAFIFLIVKKDISVRQQAEKQLESKNKLLVEVNEQLNYNIEKKKQVEMLLQNALSKEKELNELKSRFISTTSHEFRTPLTSILSSMQLVQKYRKKWSDEQLEGQFSRIKDSIFNLTGMLDDILTISHTDSGVIIFNPKIIDLQQLCLDVINEINHKASEKHNFTFNFNSEDKKFLLDPKLVRFIIINLLSNAFKYSINGGCINLNVSAGPSRLEITVSDEGIGIPGKDMENLFNPFFRGSNTAEIEGTGLGLSIVKRAVELHGGWINCRSNPGEGTIFNVKIPLGVNE